MSKIYNHIALGQVRHLATATDGSAVCFTVADNIRYEINVIDLIDY